MTAVIKRRWFAYSLRTLFVVVTLFACWLGWNVNAVRQRQSLLPEIEAENLAWERIQDRILGGPYRGGELLVGHIARFPAPPAKISLVRRMLGDKACVRIDCHTEADASKVMRLFPEASVIYYEPLIGSAGALTRAFIDTEFGRPKSSRPP